MVTGSEGNRQVQRMNRAVWIKIVLLMWIATAAAEAAEPDVVVNLWTDSPPGFVPDVGEEQDFTKPEDRPVAGRRIIKLGNVRVPQAHVYLAPAEKRTGAAVVVCPGGGYNILAWDLEGTEVAEWLNSLGITAIILKYRVPTGRQDPKWMAPVQDAQRCISQVRAHADDWQLNSERIGVLGFSAGGETAARAALATERYYEAADEVDQQSCGVHAAILIYPAYLSNDAVTGLRENIVVTSQSPPMFLAHAYDDPVTPASSLYMALALKQKKVPAELHLYDAGGHGYGLRDVDGLPVTHWDDRCAEWLRRNGWGR